MATDTPMLRFMLLSALIGFFVFCASYTILVWKKRRQSSAPAHSSSRVRGWSVTCLVLGILGLGITIAIREAVRADGMLGGDGLYAIRSSADLRVVQLADEGPVKEGDILARFASPETQAEIDQAEISRDVLKTEKERLLLQPLPPNPELVRRHDHAAAERRQILSRLTYVQLTFRDLTQSIATQRDMLGKIENDFQVAQGELGQAVVKRDISAKQLKREREFAAKANISANDLNEREKEFQSLEVEVVKLEGRLKATVAQRKQCQESLDKLEKQSAEQGAQLSAELADTKKELERAKIECARIEKLLVDDEKVAQQRRERELEEYDFKVKQADVQLLAKRNKLEVKAPYDGQVIYRHSSPGTALNQGTVLVLSPPEGLRFRFRLAQEQVDALRKAGTIVVELEETANNVEQRFPAHFLTATTLLRDPGMALVDLECQAPPETVAALAEGKPIKARFSWRPPLMNMTPMFPISLVLIVLGIFGLVTSSLSGWASLKSTTPNDDDEDLIATLAKPPAAKEGDTTEDMADTIPVRPELPGIPKEAPVQPWEHPVGIRLREALIRENVAPELLDAVETAIEVQQDAVIVPIREAFRRAPTLPDHARNLLDKLNSCDVGDEMTQISQRCLAQRITFLFYTIGLEIPNKPRTPSVVVNSAEASLSS